MLGIGWQPAHGRRHPPEAVPAARIQALLLISSLLAFQSGRSISLRAMRWSTIGREELALVLAALDAQIDAIGRRRGGS
jgi:TetR/AcrR family transcriptional regulator, regulator of cefoperazone and chloramphenicol sensitivity